MKPCFEFLSLQYVLFTLAKFDTTFLKLLKSHLCSFKSKVE